MLSSARIISCSLCLVNPTLINNTLRCISDKIDVMDDFTTELMTKKTQKWISKMPIIKTETPLESFRLKNRLKCIKESEKFNVDISNMSQCQIDALILEPLKTHRLDEVEMIIEQCIKKIQFPSIPTILRVLKVYSENGKVESVLKIQKFYCDSDPKIYAKYYEFMHYLAYSLWIKGNVEKALLVFIKMNTNMKNTRHLVNLFIERLIKETVENRSEASLVILNKYLLVFVNNWNDWKPMTHFWTSLWLSNWFSDQQLANDIFVKYPKLRETLDKHLISLVFTALKYNNDDAVSRLLELVLLCEMKSTTICIVRILFDHKMKFRDAYGCKEIVQMCTKLDIKLSNIQYEQYLKMFISSENLIQPESKIITRKHPMFKFKF